jgi:hypothetical protein
MILTIAGNHRAVQRRSFDANLPANLRGWTTAGRDLETGHFVTLPPARRVRWKRA